MSFTKLFGSILDSTVWQQPGHVRLVWITMLAMKDIDGVVEASIPGLAKRAGVSIDEAESALAALMAPDPYSRTKDYEGRRIAEVDGGWRVLNHHKYRERMDAEESRQKRLDRQARWKAKKNGKDAPKRRSETPGDGRRRSADAGRPHTESEAEAEAGSGVVSLGSESGSGSPSSTPPATTGGGDHARPPAAPPPVRPEPLDRGGGRASGFRVPPSGARQDATTRAVAHVPAAGLVPPDPSVARRRALVDSMRERINAARREIAAELGLGPVQPMPLHGGEKETQLRARIAEAGDLAEEEVEHVLEIAIAEARKKKTVQWLGWSLGRNWTTLMQKTLADVERDGGGGQERNVFDEVDRATAAIKAARERNGGDGRD